nr:integrase, catalytic region, zinc finger, CCHC-type, peptidase aspartic, catalytic [Tanacetum cinerariifolium]
MFTDEHALDYSSPLIVDEYDDDFLEVESDTENVYDDPFDSKGEKIKESKLLIDELDLPCDFLPSKYDSFISQDFYRVDALPSTNNEDKVFNPGILDQEKSFEIITRVVQDKKLATSNASLVRILIILSMNLFSSKKFPGQRGKENEIYILQPIDHGPFELGTTRDTLDTTPEGGVLIRPERPCTYDDFNDNEKKQFDADLCATNIVLQGLPKDIYKLINHNIEAKAIWDNL